MNINPKVWNGHGHARTGQDRCGHSHKRTDKAMPGQKVHPEGRPWAQRPRKDMRGQNTENKDRSCKAMTRQGHTQGQGRPGELEQKPQRCENARATLGVELKGFDHDTGKDGTRKFHGTDANAIQGQDRAGQGKARHGIEGQVKEGRGNHNAQTGQCHGKRQDMPGQEQYQYIGKARQGQERT